MQHFIVIELQTLASGQVANFVFAYTDRNEADSKFYDLLHVAAISDVPIHSVVLLDNYSSRLDGKTYIHIQPEPEPEPDSE